MLLWLSYQRYALAGTAGLAGLGLGAVALGHAWWAWLGVALAALATRPLIAHVWRGYPRKWRATALATRRISAGTFRPESLIAYCSDPCWRVVAFEILRRSGMRHAERRTLVAELRARHHAQSHALIIIDHKNGTLVQVEGDGAVRTSLPPQAT